MGTLFKPSHFPSSDMRFDGERYWRSLRLRGTTMGVELRSAGSARHPSVHVLLHATRPLSSSLVEQVADELAYRLDLATDLASFEHICGKDPMLEPVIARWRGMRVSATLSLYEFLVVTTVLQNTTVRRSVQMLEALFRRFGRRVAFGGLELNGFWDPGELDTADELELRALKLGYRAKTLKRQAKAFAERAVDERALRRASDPALRDALLGLYGVGPASVWYLQFELFKRHGAFEHVSPWEQRIFSRLMFDRDLVAPEKILRAAERRWGAWKMLAAHYLFEDLFWQHRTQPVPWLEAIIRM